MRALIRRFIKTENGATAVEYGLLIAMLSLAIVAGIGTAGDSLQRLWGSNNGRVAQGMNSH